jgi:hypothetical protein
MTIDYSQILSRKYPNQEWTMDGDEYAGLTWLSDTPKPTKKTLDDLWDEVKLAMLNEKNHAVALRDSAIAKLAALGLTIDEVKAMLG